MIVKLLNSYEKLQNILNIVKMISYGIFKAKILLNINRTL
jgi:hypothetical protein